METTLIYTTSTCPNCEYLKTLLLKEGIPYEIRDMRSAAGAAELFSSGVFSMTAPILKFKGKFHTDLTDAGKLDVKKVKSIVGIKW